MTGPSGATRARPAAAPGSGSAWPAPAPGSASSPRRSAGPSASGRRRARSCLAPGDAEKEEAVPLGAGDLLRDRTQRPELLALVGEARRRDGDDVLLAVELPLQLGANRRQPGISLRLRRRLGRL